MAGSDFAMMVITSFSTLKLLPSAHIDLYIFDLLQCFLTLFYCVDRVSATRFKNSEIVKANLASKKQGK